MKPNLIDELESAISAIEQEFKIAQEVLIAAGTRISAFEEATRDLMDNWDGEDVVAEARARIENSHRAVAKLRALLESK